ncbi:hypothetical protein SOVF_047470 [Spinacia oleracea]|nr:hypothetical protein SOVF_047470 [Spinacia oleracea]
MSSCQEKMPGCQGKKSWPELIGKDGEDAAEIIKSENCFVKLTVVVPEGSLTIFDFRCDRVFIFVDSCKKVVHTPSIG